MQISLDGPAAKTLECYYCPLLLGNIEELIEHLDKHYYEAMKDLPENKRFPYQRIRV